jgi:prepilin peptidase CpaA
MVALLVPDLACLILCVIAAVLDLRSRRIPNWLTLPGILAGLVVNGVVFGLTQGLWGGLLTGLVSSLAGALLCLLVFGLFGFMGFVGMGDVKLMAAVGALLRWPTALWGLAYVALSGGAIALAVALGRGRMGGVLHNIGALARGAFRRRRSGPAPQVTLHRIPYGVAILAGAAWAVAARYLPSLRVPF